MHWSNELHDYVLDWRDRCLSDRDELKIKELKKMRTDACGIGTRKMKNRLGKMAKNDPLAKAYYLAFNAEECSINAKAYSFQKSHEYCDYYYEKKSDLIFSLVVLCKANNYKFGVEYSEFFKLLY